jgi:PAS domain S-box-containing protein
MQKTEMPVGAAGKQMKVLSLDTFLTRLIWLCVLPLVFLAIYLAINYVYTLQAQRDQEAADRVRNIMTALDRHVEAQISALQMLAASPLVNKRSQWSEFYKEAQSFRQSFSGHVIFAGLSRQMIFNTRVPFGSKLPKLPELKGYAAAPVVLETGQPAVSDLFLGPVAKEPLVSLAVPVIRNGKIRFLLLATIETSHIQQHLDEMALPAGWSLTAIDGKGKIMAHRSPHDKDSGEGSNDMPGRFSAKSSVSHWSVVLEIPRDTYRSPIVTASITLIAAILIATFVGIFGGRLAGRRLSRAVRALTEKTTTRISGITIAEIETARSMLESAAAAMRESEEKYHAFFRNSMDAILLISPDGTIHTANPSACAMLGRTESEICTLGRKGLVDKNDPRMHAVLAERSRTGKVYGELTMLRKDGTPFPVEISSALFQDSQGNTLASMIIHDITERKRAEAALRDAEARYRMLFDHSPDGIVILDPEKAHILEFNETACRQLGYSSEEFAQLSISDFEASEKPDETRSRISKVIREGRNDFETLHRTRQGEIRNIHVTAQVTEILGRRVYHCVWRDITERRRLQYHLWHAQKLEGIGQLAGGIAHDFNNVLNAVIGYAGLIQMQMDKDDPARKFVDEIAEAGLRGAALTRQLLVFSSKQVLDMKPVNINDIIRNLQQMLLRLVREDIIIKLNLVNKDLVVMADAGQIDQVLINLTTNARDAMTGGGNIVISTEFFIMDNEFVETHGYDSPGKYALITFSDTGCGMDAGTESRIFDPFFTTKERGKVTGLGLAVVHGILKQHGGYINVNSQPGKGTIFNLYLPLTDTAAEKAELTQTLDRRGGTETILIAEDDASLRKLSRTVLASFGYKVIEAVDGEDAIVKFAENSDVVKLVILDGIMPEKNGKEAFEAIRELRPDIKTIFMSGYTDGTFTHKDISDKGAAFIQKPVKPDDLLRIVREMLDAV